MLSRDRHDKRLIVIAGTHKYVHAKCLRRWQDTVQKRVQWKDKFDGGWHTQSLQCAEACSFALYNIDEKPDFRPSC